MTSVFVATEARPCPDHGAATEHVVWLCLSGTRREAEILRDHTVAPVHNHKRILHGNVTRDSIEVLGPLATDVSLVNPTQSTQLGVALPDVGKMWNTLAVNMSCEREDDAFAERALDLYADRAYHIFVTGRQRVFPRTRPGVQFHYV